MIEQLVDSVAIVSEIGAKTKDAALKELLAVAQAGGGFGARSAKALGKRLADREAIGSTGLGNGVAVPHVKGEDVAAMALVLARAKGGIEWQAIDGRPVHVLFLLVSPAGEPENHLKCLRWIATLARSADFRRFLMDAADADAMRDLLREMAPKE
ncbi:MAG TPA: PTS sugar transporter subunit IIA [Planctomycetota bacterium]|nr:PTS sugar transporter subunit IIA [Planctomycetota bacterium]